MDADVFTSESRRFAKTPSRHPPDPQRDGHQLRRLPTHSGHDLYDGQL